MVNLDKKSCFFILAVFVGTFNFSFSLLASPSRAAMLEASCSKKAIKKLEKEVLKDFTLFEAPITPKAIQLMETWQSDFLPVVKGVDLLALPDSNQVFGEITKEEKAGRTYYTVYAKDKLSYYSYCVLGKVGKDKIILSTLEYSGGSLVTASLKVLQIKITKNWLPPQNTPLPNPVSAPLPCYTLLAYQVFSSVLPFLGDFSWQGKRLILTADAQRLTFDFSSLAALK